MESSDFLFRKYLNFTKKVSEWFYLLRSPLLLKTRVAPICSLSFLTEVLFTPASTKTNYPWIRFVSEVTLPLSWGSFCKLLLLFFFSFFNAFSDSPFPFPLFLFPPFYFTCFVWTFLFLWSRGACRFFLLYFLYKYSIFLAVHVVCFKEKFSWA